MSKMSKEVENRLKVSEKVVASARAHRDKVASILAERVVAEEGTNPATTVAAYKGIINSLALLLERASQRLEQKELGYTAEQADDVEPRKKRDAELPSCIAFMLKLRGNIQTNLGVEALKTYGLQGETPRVPSVLLRHMRNVANLLDEKPVSISNDVGGTFDTTLAANSVRNKAAAFEAILGDVTREERELEGALVERDRMVNAWVDTYQGVANALVGLYRLAGYTEFAERVRPTRRTTSGEDPGPELPPAPESTS